MQVMGIFICVGGILCAPQAQAKSTSTKLDSQNITNLSLTIMIKTKIRGDQYHFRVTVEPKSERVANHTSGRLQILEGEDEIANRDVKEVRTRKAVTYKFMVSSKDLANSKFTFANYDDNGPAADFYWFHLKDFGHGR